MNVKALKGIVSSLNTPFDEDGNLDEAAIPRLVDHCAAAGCAGVLGLAVAGETTWLGIAQKRRLIPALVDATAGRLPLVLGVSGGEFADSLLLARQARGAGALLWQPPQGVQPDMLATMIERLCDAADLPLILQDLDWQGEGIALDVLEDLVARLPRLAGIKIETAPAGPKYSAVLERFGDALHVSGGWAAAQMPDALERGIDAFIPTGLEPVYVAITERHAAGDRAGAVALFERLLPILAFSNQHIEVSIRFFKLLRREEGLFASAACRPQVRPLDPVQAHTADEMVRRALALQEEVRAGAA